MFHTYIITCVSSISYVRSINLPFTASPRIDFYIIAISPDNAKSTYWLLAFDIYI